MSLRPGLGWHPDDPDTRDKVAEQTMLKTGTLPSAVRNSDIVKVVNQGGLGSCTVNAAGQAVRAAELLERVEAMEAAHVAAGGSPASFDRVGALQQAQAETEFWCRLMMYYLARAYAGDTAEDTGARIRNVFRAANHYGYAPESSWTYDDDSRSRVGKFAKMPPASVFRLAYDQRDNKANQDANLIDYARITATGSARIKEIKTALAQRHLVVFGGPVTEEFCSDGTARNGAPIPRPTEADQIAGGHALCLGGYDNDSGEVINSWGEDWGGQGGLPPGWCRFSWDYLTWDQCGDFWIVKRAPLLPSVAAMKLGLISVVLLLVACGNHTNEPVPQKGDCKAWCAHATELGCDAAKPTARGASCEEVCTNLLAGPAHFDTACRARAATCEAADACENPPDQPVSTAPATCAGWCKHAAALHCDAARPTPAGAPCEEVCKNVQDGPVHFDLACRVKAPTCATAEACEAKRK